MKWFKGMLERIYILILFLVLAILLVFVVISYLPVWVFSGKDMFDVLDVMMKYTEKKIEGIT